MYSFGYNDYALDEKRHPNRYELDWVSTEHPVVFEHYSGHVLAANSMAMHLLNINESSTTPPGGVYERFENGTLTGLFKEAAIAPFTEKYRLKVDALSRKMIERGIQAYFSSGVTTAQDTFFTMAEPTEFRSLGNDFPIDVNGYSYVSSKDLSKFYDTVKNYGTSWMKVKGVKFIIDGSIQAYTGLLTQPYWVPKEKQYDNLDNYTYNSSRSCQTEHCGENYYSAQPNLLKELFLTLHDQDFDILAHCNGDGAVDLFLEAVSFVRKEASVRG